MIEAPNPENAEAQADPHDPEGLDAAAEAFAKKVENKPEEAGEADDSPANDADESEDTEAEEADPGAEEDSEELVEVELNGKTYKVPPELQKGNLRQADYSRKMNEVAAREKQLTERLQTVESLTTGSEKYAESLAKVRILEAQLSQVDAADWASLEASDPNEAARLAVRQMRLQQELTRATQEAQQIAQTVNSERNKLMETARRDMHEALSKSLKGWGDELGTKLTEYATKTGVKVETLQTLTDPGLVVALDKARRFDELQASKSALKAKVQAAPQVAKPGAPRKVDPKTDAMARLRKSNSIDDAAAAFMARRP